MVCAILQYGVFPLKDISVFPLQFHLLKKPMECCSSHSLGQVILQLQHINYYILVAITPHHHSIALRFANRSSNCH